MKKFKLWFTWILIIQFLCLFIYYVWPTPFIIITNDDEKYAVARINRFTGTKDYAGYHGWYRHDPPENSKPVRDIKDQGLITVDSIDDSDAGLDDWTGWWNSGARWVIESKENLTNVTMVFTIFSDNNVKLGTIEVTKDHLIANERVHPEVHLYSDNTTSNWPSEAPNLNNKRLDSVTAQ